MDPDQVKEILILVHQTGIGAIFVYALQLLKNSQWFPIISNNSATLNRWIGLAIAVLTSLGFKLVGMEHLSTGGYHFTFFVPEPMVLLDAIEHAAAQFAGQQILYHTAVKDTVGGMRTIEMESGTVSGAVVQAAVGEVKTEPKP